MIKSSSAHSLSLSILTRLGSVALNHTQSLTAGVPSTGMEPHGSLLTPPRHFWLYPPGPLLLPSQSPVSTSSCLCLASLSHCTSMPGVLTDSQRESQW